MKKSTLSEYEIPKKWYNLAADLPFQTLPPLHPGTRQPIGPDDLAPLFPMDLIMQEVSTERYITIPDPVLDILRLWRPTPLVRANFLEEALGTKSRIFFKNESVSPAGSHKPNTAIPQAYYNARENVKTLTTETGAGQWGSALSLACNYFDLDCRVFMVRISYDTKPYRKAMIETWGGSILASPSNTTNAGRSILKQDPDSPGSLGIAISEAVEVAAMDESTKYSLGSVLNHVMIHQTIIGEEARKQLINEDIEPDVIIGCVGGGSNFAGLAFPFLKDKFDGKPIEFIAAEPASCPSLTRGKFGYDFGDTAELTPLLPMNSLGHTFMPAKIHAGGLRYHGMSPQISALAKEGYIKPRAFNQKDCFEAAVQFARTEGIIPAPESSHAIAAVIAMAREADKEGVSKTILFNLSGHGHFDMAAYNSYLEGGLSDRGITDEEIKSTIDSMPDIM